MPFYFSFLLSFFPFFCYAHVAWPPIVDGEGRASLSHSLSPPTTATIFNHFSAHILLRHTHLYSFICAAPTNEYIFLWVGARSFTESFFMCCFARCLCVPAFVCISELLSIFITSIFHLEKENPFLSALTTVFLVFLSTCRDDLVFL